MKQLKNPNLYRTILNSILFTFLMYFSVKYTNAMHTYEQLFPLKHISVIFPLILLVLMDVKMWCNIFSLIYAPIAFLVIKFGYQYRFISDPFNYEKLDISRLNKVSLFLWGLVLVCIIRDLIKNKGYRNFQKKNKFFMILWVLYAVWLLIFIKPNYSYVLFITVGFTITYYLMAKEEKRKLILNAFLYGIILSSFIIMYKSLKYRPYDTERYNGFFINSNNAGFYYSTVFICLFSKISYWFHSSHKKALKIPVLICLFLYTGFFGCINIYNYTRTTLAGILFSVGILFVLDLIRFKGKRGKTILRYVLILVSMIALFNATYFAIRYIPAKVDNPHFFTWECDEENDVLKGDPIDSPKYTSMTQFLRMALGKWGIYIKVDDVEANEFELEHGNDGVTFDKDRDYTNGRTEIWQRYLPLMRFTGHDVGHLILEDGDVLYHAHNTYFQTAYQYGIPAGVMLLLLNIVCFILAGKQLLKRKEFSAEETFTFLMVGTCLIGFFTEWIGNPVYSICFALYLCFGSIFHRTEKAEDESSAS